MQQGATSLFPHLENQSTQIKTAETEGGRLGGSGALE